LSDLPKIAPEGELLAKLEKILKMYNWHLTNKTVCRFYVKWKDCLEEEASWKREVDLRRDYPNFDIENNDF